MTDPTAKPRGFAAWTPEARRAAAVKGGRAAHAGGRAHEFTSDEAREAGRKGGIAAHRARGRAVDTAERGETTGNVPNTSRDA